MVTKTGQNVPSGVLEHGNGYENGSKCARWRAEEGGVLKKVVCWRRLVLLKKYVAGGEGRNYRLGWCSRTARCQVEVSMWV